MTMLTETSMFDFRIKVTHFFYLIIKIIVSQATKLFIPQRKYVAKNTYLSPHKGQFSLPTTKDAPPPPPPPQQTGVGGRTFLSFSMKISFVEPIYSDIDQMIFFTDMPIQICFSNLSLIH